VEELKIMSKSTTNMKENPKEVRPTGLSTGEKVA